MLEGLEELYPKEFLTMKTCPGKRVHHNLAQSAVNAAVLAGCDNWTGAIKKLMAQACRLHRLPQHMDCIGAFLESEGFFRQKLTRKRPKMKAVVDYLNENWTGGETAVVLVRGMFRRDQFCAMLPRNRETIPPEVKIPEELDSRYVLGGLSCPLDPEVTHLWVRWPDGQDHSRTKYRTQKKAAGTDEWESPPDHNYFHYCQKNPEHFEPDCVIRAVASVFDLSWEEAVDEIAEASGYESAVLNVECVYRRLLERELFVHHKTPAGADRIRMKGDEFCRFLDTAMTNGERVFAHLGSQHVAAILPIPENGETHYKIVDCWDSSDELVGEYWVSPRFWKKNHGDLERKLHDGMRLVHPTYGAGTVVHAYASGWVQMEFDSVGCRWLVAGWVRKNCKPESGI